MRGALTLAGEESKETMPLTVWRALERARRPLLQNQLGSSLYRLARPGKPRFICPLCRYEGPFVDVHPETGVRRHAVCPSCGAAERHRLQYLVLERLGASRDFSTMSVLHCAPEPFFRRVLRERFGRYLSVDLTERRDVDQRADLRCLPFRDASYDFVFASHVLEHIREDHQALDEIRRVLRRDGLALLPVPILAARTVEYPAPNPHESGHVRAPGIDYYERLSSRFSRVELYDSHSFPEEFQPFIYEDRSSWPSTMPLRPTMAGTKHRDVVPVCYP